MVLLYACTWKWAESIICRHIHAEYAGKKIVMSLDGEILQGDFPSKQLQLLKAWMIIHHEDLQANWELLSSGEPIFRIDPLK